MKNKGITLIALAITIIVLLILAGVSINLVLGENGIIAKATMARELQEIARIKEEAELVKAAAIVDYKGNDLTQSELASLIKDKFEGSTKSGNSVITEDGYKIVVDSNLNITVEKSDGTEPEEEELNQYGFFFEKLYLATNIPEGLEIDASRVGVVFHEDENGVATAEAYMGFEEVSETDIFCTMALETGIIYTNNKITIDSMGTTCVVSDDGNTIEFDGAYDGLVATCTSSEIHGMYIGSTYSTTGTVTGSDGETTQCKMTMVLNDNVLSWVTEDDGGINEEFSEDMEVALVGKNHVVLLANSGETMLYVSIDGKKIFNPSIGVLELEGSSNSVTTEDGAIITPVSGSTVEDIMAGKPKTGDTIEYDGYIYKYNQVYAWLTQKWNNLEDANVTGSESGWGVKVKDDTLSSYPDMQSYLYNVPVTNLSNTFYNCTNLVTSPKLSEAAKSLENTFYNCTSLTNCPEIPSGVVSMEWTFSSCTSLVSATDLVIPSGVTKLHGTFECSGIKETPVIPETVTKLYRTFWGCNSLEKTPLLHDNVEDLGLAFGNCTNLTQVQNIPESVISLDSTFQSCTALTTVPAIPASVTEISYTFNGCTALTGTITINSTTLENYVDCFTDTVLEIQLAGSCPTDILTLIADLYDNVSLAN